MVSPEGSEDRLESGGVTEMVKYLPRQPGVHRDGESPHQTDRPGPPLLPPPAVLLSARPVTAQGSPSDLRHVSQVISLEILRAESPSGWGPLFTAGALVTVSLTHTLT